MPPDGVSLTDPRQAVALLFSLATTLGLLWVVEHRQRVVPRHAFKQARKIALLTTAVAIALIFAFLNDLSRLSTLGAVAGTLAVAAVALFLWNVWTALQMLGAQPRQVIVYLGTFIGYFTCGCAALYAGGLLFMLYVSNPLNRAEQVAYDISIALTGHRSPSPRLPLSFQAASPRINVACDDTQRVSVIWQLPPGADLDGAPRVEWIDLDDARAVDAGHEVEGRRIVANGRLAGPPLQRIRLPIGGSVPNCFKRGSGTLRVSGRYISRQPGLQPYQTELAGRLVPGRGEAALAMQLPERDVTLTMARMTASREGRVLDDLTLTFVDGVAPETSSRNEVFSAAANGRELRVKLREGDR